MTIPECRCGYEKCRGRVNGDDLLRYGAAWDEKIRAALVDVLSVQQPLWEILRSGVQDEVQAAVADPRLVPPCTTMLIKRGSTTNAPIMDLPCGI